jgi:hypothetical protein
MSTRGLARRRKASPRSSAFHCEMRLWRSRGRGGLRGRGANLLMVRSDSRFPIPATRSGIHVLSLTDPPDDPDDSNLVKVDVRVSRLVFLARGDVHRARVCIRGIRGIRDIRRIRIHCLQRCPLGQDAHCSPTRASSRFPIPDSRFPIPDSRFPPPASRLPPPAIHLSPRPVYLP